MHLKRTIRERQNRYFTALGRFIDAFSEAEARMQGLLRACSGVKPEVSRALFSGTRAQEAMSYIRRLHEANNLELPDYLADAFKQLAEINQFRNDVVHHGTNFDEEGRPTIVTTKKVAHVATKIREHQVSPRILRDITSDLHEIDMRLIEAIFATIGAKRSPLAGQRRAWLYKPSEQGRPRKSPRAEARSRKLS